MKPLIKEINSKSPQFGEDCYVSENATIIGDVDVRRPVQFLVQLCHKRRCSLYKNGK